MARITHPTFAPGRSKGLAGIEFIDGFAEVDLGDNDILRQALVQHGYGIDETVGLDERTVAELRAELEGLGYDVKTSWRKPELIERLAQHRELNTEKFATAELPDGTVIGDGESLATLPVAED
ncbi:SAP domain-containing protein [Mycetocola miduiensis]|uniref:SAP domain-containing protein n=1 Tax=Mycetocola miduiensis TaxID=995034 RepID=A0A1I5AV01_9MICO|nr:SAP domain-containing protein [Mycetocola miduiensis]SFN66255.1 hypothetical protein SAMN05216219_1556 [Mycetocola miduiensis]